ncbi:twin-arginine translocase TatA/TatE family subunit [Brachybacterium sp. MASK1Z-5]|uniref:Twin-arginine translocase TatA/TatE family subunit n=1 Tax=Brachybacterium halotolerans TaxID=2795215 RepID=A0ABS1B791_9MICO|nr:twin-arginine translocase TatA/TatE family subunit [Brachybacterium sp. ACRRE]MBK0330471.1 twin-arginine translocase TatA/TatE family subunit [Brachybacterium halotolerans]
MAGGLVDIFGGWEILILLIVFVIFIGPQRLPEYTRNIVQWVRKARRWVDDSRATVEDEMGLSMDELRKYDPRQYDPRRIIRDAWGDTSVDDILPDTKALTGAVTGTAAAASGSKRSTKGSTEDEGPQRAPFDDEAT